MTRSMNEQSSNTITITNKPIHRLCYVILPITMALFILSFWLYDKSLDIVGTTELVSAKFSYACNFMNFCNSMKEIISYLIVGEIGALVGMFILSVQAKKNR